MKRRNAAMAALMALACLSPRAAAPQDRANLLPGLDGDVQRLRFHTGGVANRQPEISPVLPDIPGPPSPWFVAQWRLGDKLDPQAMTVDDPATRDARLGVAAYAFTAADDRAHVWIYRDRARKRAVYELYERDGPLTDDGGANVYLTRDAPRGGVAINQSLELTLEAKLSKASLTATAKARSSGVVSAQIYAEFVVHFPDPASGKASTLYLQFPFSGSRPPAAYRSCRTDGVRRVMQFDATPGDAWPLPFEPDAGPPRTMTFKLFDAICQLVQKPMPCVQPDHSRASWSAPDNVTDFHNWRITSLHVGLETQNSDQRGQSTDRTPQGSVEAGLQIADLQLHGDPAAPSDLSFCQRR